MNSFEPFVGTLLPVLASLGGFQWISRTYLDGYIQIKCCISEDELFSCTKVFLWHMHLHARKISKECMAATHFGTVFIELYYNTWKYTYNITSTTHLKL